MIYLIKSACFKNVNDINCNEYETILKIGYTRDDRASVRLATYRTENPGAIPIYSIPGGTEQDEKNLHNHFKKYLKYGQEWFSYESEILEFFKTHTTKESLKELKIYHGNRNSRSFNKYRKERNRLIPELSKKYISKVLSNLEVSDKYFETIEYLQEKLNELLEDSLDLNIVDDYFKLSYPNINFSEDHILDSDVSKVVDEIENNLSNFTDRMKYIYSLDFDSYFMKLILDNLSDSCYAKYYYSISKERASALKYQKGNLEKEYKEQKVNQTNVSQVIKDIKSRFKPGEKYSKSEIKETLRTVYESNGYNKTPKASDLEEYFELRLCKIFNEFTGKRDHGFEIIKEK
jgi:hypothetical protein